MVITWRTLKPQSYENWGFWSCQGIRYKYCFGQHSKWVKQHGVSLVAKRIVKR